MAVSIQSPCELRPCFVVSGPKQSPRSPPVLVWPPPVYIDGAPFVPLRAKDNWLCTFLTGASSKKRPLSGIDFPGIVRDAMRETPSKGDDAASAANLGLAVQKRNTKEKNPPPPCGIICEVEVPPPPGTGDGVPNHRLRCTLLCHNRGIIPAVELCPENLKWLYETANAPVRQKRDRNQMDCLLQDIGTREPGLVWSRTENAWICRGPTRTKRFRIPTTTDSGEQWDPHVYRTMMVSARDAAMEELQRQKMMTSSSDVGSSAELDRGRSRDSLTEVAGDDDKGSKAAVTESPPEARDVSPAVDSDLGGPDDDEQTIMFGGLGGLSGDESD